MRGEAHQHGARRASARKPAGLVGASATRAPHGHLMLDRTPVCLRQVLLGRRSIMQQPWNHRGTIWRIDVLLNSPTSRAGSAPHAGSAGTRNLRPPRRQTTGRTTRRERAWPWARHSRPPLAASQSPEQVRHGRGGVPDEPQPYRSARLRSLRRSGSDVVDGGDELAQIRVPAPASGACTHVGLCPSPRRLPRCAPLNQGRLRRSERQLA